MPSGALLVALGALGFAADPATWDAAWEIVNAEPSPMASPSAKAVYRMLYREGIDAPQRLTPSTQGRFWSVLCNFLPACEDAWRAKAAAPSPSPEANGWWHDAWATRVRHHARDPESYADLWESPLTEADVSYEPFGRLRSNEYPYDYVYDYDYEYSTWPWGVVDADPSPALHNFTGAFTEVWHTDGFDYENYDYDYSTNLYYWDGDETP